MTKSSIISIFRLSGHVLLLSAALLRLAIFFHAGLRKQVRTRFNYRILDLPLATGLCLLVVSHYLISLFYVPSRSMLPTLEVGDGIAVNRLSYYFREPEIGEIVVFYLPQEFPGGGKIMVKRIVAAAGDVIRIEKGLLYRNGQAENKVYEPTHASIKEHKVAPGCLYVMGDHRGSSLDSRIFGDIKKDWLYGPVIYRYWPPKRLGKV